MRFAPGDLVIICPCEKHLFSIREECFNLTGLDTHVMEVRKSNHGPVAKVDFKSPKTGRFLWVLECCLQRTSLGCALPNKKVTWGTSPWKPEGLRRA